MPETKIVVFDTVKDQIAKARSYVEESKFDYEDPKQNKEARSLIARVRKLKAPLNLAHKEAKAEALSVCKALDTMKRECLAEIDELIDVHDKPVQAVADRKATEEQKRLDDIRIEAERVAKAESDRLEAQRLKQVAKEEELKKREDKVKQAEREKKIKADAEAKATRDANAAIATAKSAADARIRQAAQDVKDNEADLILKAKVAAVKEAERVADVGHRASVKAAVIQDLDLVLDDMKMSAALFEMINAGDLNYVLINY